MFGVTDQLAASSQVDAKKGRPRTWPSLLLVAVFVVGFVLVSSVVLVRGRLLDAGLYAEALVRTDAYERAYTEVLADPEFAELTEELLGGLDLGAQEPTQVRALATSMLRLTVAPSTLRQGTETFIEAVLAYLRGDTARLDADVDATEVLGRIPEGGVAWVHTRLAPSRESVSTSIGGYREAVDSFADRLAAGKVPDAIPVIGGTTVDPGQVLDAIYDRLGPNVDPRVREQIRAAVLSGDERDALIDATTPLIAGSATAAAGDLRASLEDRRELDVITEVADRAGRSKAAIVDQLNTVRDAARWLGRPTAVAGVAIMSHRSRRDRLAEPAPTAVGGLHVGGGRRRLGARDRVAVDGRREARRRTTGTSDGHGRGLVEPALRPAHGPG